MGQRDDLPFANGPSEEVRYLLSGQAVRMSDAADANTAHACRVIAGLVHRRSACVPLRTNACMYSVPKLFAETDAVRVTIVARPKSLACWHMHVGTCARARARTHARTHACMQAHTC